LFKQITHNQINDQSKTIFTAKTPSSPRKTKGFKNLKVLLIRLSSVFLGVLGAMQACPRRGRIVAVK
jgi:hypothetical protein